MVHFAPQPQGIEGWKYGHYFLPNLKHLGKSRALLLLMLIGGLVWIWGPSWEDGLQITRLGGPTDLGLGRQILELAATADLQFFPAINPRIHVGVILAYRALVYALQYVGRWASTPNRLRKDAAFHGAYFDVSVTNTSCFLLSLYNTASPVLTNLSKSLSVSPWKGLAFPSNSAHFSFRHSAALDKRAPPVSLLARVDLEEYILLPNSSSLVNVRLNDLDRYVQHQIRVIMPMTDDSGDSVFQLEGIWLSKSGKLRVQGSLFSQNLEVEDALYTENQEVGQDSRADVHTTKGGGKQQGAGNSDSNEEEIPVVSSDRKRLLEIITDNPGNLNGKKSGRRQGGADGLLSGVMAWEYLLGEMFDVDHVAIGIEKICLIPTCIGGVGSPYGIGDVFFRR